MACACLHFASSYVKRGRIAVYISFLKFLHNKSGSLRCRRYTLVRSGLHLELVHSVPGLGDVDLVVALHFRFSPFDFFRGFSSAVIALPLLSGISLLVSGKTG